MSRTKRQHEMAIGLLQKLELDYIWLDPIGGGANRYRAWKVPSLESNGTGLVVKRGKVAAR